ncbi:MAG: beta-galactosidase, partial [bacterium]|nr:beta-galactosidase [bacterium]
MHTHIATTALFMGAGLVLGVGTGLAFAGEITPPAGLYCSCPPTTGNGSGSVIPEVAQLDHVDGVLVRMEWATLEPSPGVYDWSLLDEQISRADQYGIKVSLAVVNG